MFIKRDKPKHWELSIQSDDFLEIHFNRNKNLLQNLALTTLSFPQPCYDSAYDCSSSQSFKFSVKNNNATTIGERTFMV